LSFSKSRVGGFNPLV